MNTIERAKLRKQFMDRFVGIPAHVLSKALDYHTPGRIWPLWGGCSKSRMADYWSYDRLAKDSRHRAPDLNKVYKECQNILRRSAEEKLRREEQQAKFNADRLASDQQRKADQELLKSVFNLAIQNINQQLDSDRAPIVKAKMDAMLVKIRKLQSKMIDPDL